MLKGSPGRYLPRYYRQEEIEGWGEPGEEAEPLRGNEEGVTLARGVWEKEKERERERSMMHPTPFRELASVLSSSLPSVGLSEGRGNRSARTRGNNKSLHGAEYQPQDCSWNRQAPPCIDEEAIYAIARGDRIQNSKGEPISNLHGWLHFSNPLMYYLRQQRLLYDYCSDGNATIMQFNNQFC